MPYQRPKRWSYRFELSPDLPEDVVLHDFLATLTGRNELARLIKQMLRDMAARVSTNEMPVDTPLTNEPVSEPPVDTPKVDNPTSVDQPTKPKRKKRQSVDTRLIHEDGNAPVVDTPCVNDDKYAGLPPEIRKRLEMRDAGQAKHPVAQLSRNGKP